MRNKSYILFRDFVQSLLISQGYRLIRNDYSISDAYQIQKQLLKNTDVKLIFDVGAHYGEAMSEYRKLFSKDITIYSFEPFSESYTILVDNVGNDPSVRTFRLAFSDRNEKMQFYSNVSSATNSLLPVHKSIQTELKLNDTTMYKQIDHLEIPTSTIDAFCLHNKIDNIDILKLDVQGGELLVLQGAQQKLRDEKIALLYAEVMFKPLYEHQPMFHEICAFLNEFGYQLLGLYNLTHLQNKQLLQADAIFLSPSMSHTL